MADQRLAPARRWRATSKHATAPATLGVERVDRPELGDRDDLGAPLAREPTEPSLLAADDERRRRRPRGRGRRWSASPPGASPTVTTPARSRSRSAVGTPATALKRRCSIAPAAVLVAPGVSRTERCDGSTTPVTPAHSALRSSAPRFRGSVSPSQTKRNAAASPAPLDELVERRRRDRGRTARRRPGGPRSAPRGRPVPARRRRRARGGPEPRPRSRRAGRRTPGPRRSRRGGSDAGRLRAARAPRADPRPGRPPRPASPAWRRRRRGAPARPGRAPRRGRHGALRSSSSTTALAAIPSARPIAPSPSVVVAFTDTGARDHGGERAGHLFERAGRAAALPPRW